jgi:hypothetical protein
MSMQARSIAALKADHERKAVAGRIPYSNVLDGIDDAAELHAAPDISPQLLPEADIDSLNQKMQRR